MILFISFLGPGDSLGSNPHFRLKNFYEQGERETLLAEVSQLRTQVYGDILFPFCPCVALQWHLIDPLRLSNAFTYQKKTV